MQHLLPQNAAPHLRQCTRGCAQDSPSGRPHARHPPRWSSGSQSSAADASSARTWLERMIGVTAATSASTSTSLRMSRSALGIFARPSLPVPTAIVWWSTGRVSATATRERSPPPALVNPEISHRNSLFCLKVLRTNPFDLFCTTFSDFNGTVGAQSYIYSNE